MVDGVQVYFANPARDTRSGLDIQETGCITLDGQQALVLRALAPLPGLRGRALAERPLLRPRSHQPPAGLHRPGARPGRRPRGAQPRHARPAGERRARHRHGRRPADGRRLHRPGPGLPRLRSRVRSTCTRCPSCPSSVGGASILRLRGRGGPADPRSLPGHGHRRPAAGRRACPRAERLRHHRSGRAGRRRSRGGRLRWRRHRRGRALRRHRDRWSATPPAARPRPTSSLATSSPSARLELVEGPLEADVVVVTGSQYAGVRTTPRPPGPVDDDHDHRPRTTTTIGSTADVVDDLHARSSASCRRSPPGVDC